MNHFYLWDNCSNDSAEPNISKINYYATVYLYCSIFDDKSKLVLLNQMALKKLFVVSIHYCANNKHAQIIPSAVQGKQNSSQQ
jgi:hypothetical protein